MAVAIEKYKSLKFIQFENVSSWSSYALLGKNLIYTQKYSFVRIGDFLIRNKEQVLIQDDILYKRPTISINGRGIKLRDEVLGKEIGTKNQFRLYKDQFLLSKIDARNGAFGVVPEALDNGIITGNFWTFDVEYSKINPHYLQLLTGTKEFQKLCQTASVGTTNRNYLQEDLFLNFEIPLPTLAEQQQIVDAYTTKIQQAQALQAQANNLEDEIERYFLEQLGVIKVKKKKSEIGINIIFFENLDRWGVDFILGLKNDNILHSNKFQNIKLKTLIEINPSTNLPRDNKLEISFIPMETVSDEYGVVIDERTKKIADSKGYTKFKNGDLIWARITPCMQNGKSAIVNNLVNGYGCGSTEFHILRSTNKNINTQYLHFILRLDIVLKNAMSHFTGSAGQQRVPKSFLEELSIPVPPIEIQNELVNHITNLKSQIQQLNINHSQLITEAEQEFEKQIFHN